MIYEFRTYTVRVGALEDCIQKFAEGYKTREHIHPITAFFHTVIGPNNEMIQVWAWEDMAHREKIRAEANKLPTWPPGLGDMVVHQEVEIFRPFSFVEAFKPGDWGPIYEMRYYSYEPGQIPKIMGDWERMLPERTSRSPIVAALYSDMGTLNKFVHLWPYKSLNDWQDIRAKAVADNVWPPRGSGIRPLRQNNKILRPAAFSPMK